MTTKDLSQIYYLKKIKTDKNNAKEKYNELVKYIDEVEDVQVKKILELRFIKHKSWLAVANNIGGNTADSVRKIATRYLKKN